MGFHIAVLNTGNVREEIRPYLDDFFRGRISYMTLCNALNKEPGEVDAEIVDVVCQSITRDKHEAVAGY